jgi:hypothetical protein
LLYYVIQGKMTREKVWTCVVQTQFFLNIFNLQLAESTDTETVERYGEQTVQLLKLELYMLHGG